MDERAGHRELDVGAIIEAAQRGGPTSPSGRAMQVHDCLVKSGRFTNWDLICFATEYLASMTGTLEWLKEPVRALVRLVYITHYIRFEEHSWLDTQPATSGGPQENEKEESGPPTSGPSSIF